MGTPAPLRSGGAKESTDRHIKALGAPSLASLKGTWENSNSLMAPVPKPPRDAGPKAVKPPREWVTPCFDAGRVPGRGVDASEAEKYMGDALWAAGGSSAFAEAFAAAPEPVKEGAPKLVPRRAFLELVAAQPRGGNEPLHDFNRRTHWKLDYTVGKADVVVVEGVWAHTPYKGDRVQQYKQQKPKCPSGMDNAALLAAAAAKLKCKNFDAAKTLKAVGDALKLKKMATKDLVGALGTPIKLGPVEKAVVTLAANSVAADLAFSAVHNNDLKRVQELFALGMSPKATRLVEIDDKGTLVQDRETLMYALDSRSVEMFELLVSNGVSVTHRMSVGVSFTSQCSLRVVGSYRLALASLKYGADPRWPCWNVYPSQHFYGEPLSPHTFLFFAIQNNIKPLFDALVTDYRDALDLEENWRDFMPGQTPDGTTTLLGLAFRGLEGEVGLHIAKRMLEEGAKVYHTLLAYVITNPSVQRACNYLDCVEDKERGKALLVEWVESHPGCVHECTAQLGEDDDPKMDQFWKCQCFATKEDRELFNKLYPVT